LGVNESSRTESKKQDTSNKSENERQMQMLEGKIDMGKALDATLDVNESSRTESKKQDTSNKSENERQMQMLEGKIDMGKALDATLDVNESSRTESCKQDTSSMSENDTHTVDADIRPVNDKEPLNEEKVESNTTPDSTNIRIMDERLTRMLKNIKIQVL
ncbi:hypothetical protein Tco_0100629, partial [Tanacetum coccineum]